MADNGYRTNQALIIHRSEVNRLPSQDPPQQARPRVPDVSFAAFVRAIIDQWFVVGRAGILIAAEECAVVRAVGGDFLWGELATLRNLVSADDIVRLTRQRPVSDRGIQRDGFAIVGEFPLRGGQWSNDFFPATATAVVASRAVEDRDVQHCGAHRYGEGVDELGGESVCQHHGVQSGLAYSFAMLLVKTEYVVSPAGATAA